MYNLMEKNFGGVDIWGWGMEGGGFVFKYLCIILFVL